MCRRWRAAPPRSESGGVSDLKPLIAIAAAGRALDESQAEQAFDILMSGDATPSQIGGFLMSLRVRGETVPEIVGAVRAMRAKMFRIEAPDGAIDTCGTGGDGAGTLNISTGAAIVTAAAGVPVAKHGNRAASSKTGAADVLACPRRQYRCRYEPGERGAVEARTSAS